jgi:O-acetyl-ADP-ribose deacetylase (regulator of RNase III)
MRETATGGGSMRIELVKGDITRLRVDAIVNAANPGLLGGGGVDGAIHRAAGPGLLEECKLIAAERGGCPTGEAVITSAYNLPCGWVIHTVGPVWRGGGRREAELLRNCYDHCLVLAETKGLSSVAFPNIGTGVYGYPKEEAAELACAWARSLEGRDSSVERIVFDCWDDENYELYARILGASAAS